MSEWIPFKVKTVHGRELVGDIPQDGQKVLISNNPYVFADTFCNDEDGTALQMLKDAALKIIENRK